MKKFGNVPWDCQFYVNFDSCKQCALRLEVGMKITYYEKIDKFSVKKKLPCLRLPSFSIKPNGDSNCYYYCYYFHKKNNIISNMVISIKTQNIPNNNVLHAVIRLCQAFIYFLTIHAAIKIYQ